MPPKQTSRPEPKVAKPPLGLEVLAEPEEGVECFPLYGGFVRRTDCARFGAPQRGVSVLITRLDCQQAWLQIRSRDKQNGPLQYDTTARGAWPHGESMAQAAARELAEEAGIHLDLSLLRAVPRDYAYKRGVELNYVGTDHAYCIGSDDLVPVPQDSSEVEAFALLDRAAIERLLRDGDIFPPAVKDVEAWIEVSKAHEQALRAQAQALRAQDQARTEDTQAHTSNTR